MVGPKDDASRLAMLFGVALVLWIAVGAVLAATGSGPDLGEAALVAEAALLLAFAVVLLGLASRQGQGAALRIGGRPAPGWGWPFGLVLIGFIPFALFTLALALISHDRPDAADIAGALLFGFGIALVKGLVFWAALRHAMVARFGVIGGVMLVALVYGLFHLLNLLNGWSLTDALAQAGHAVLAGLLYASLAQRVGVLWPVIVVQGIWETQISFWLLADGPSNMAGSAILQLAFPLHLALDDVVFAFWLPEPVLGLLLLLGLFLRQRRGAPDAPPEA